MNAQNGVWTAVGRPDWKGKFYLYEVTVYVPRTGAVEHNVVTDPYSRSLSTNSRQKPDRRPVRPRTHAGGMGRAREAARSRLPRTSCSTSFTSATSARAIRRARAEFAARTRRSRSSRTVRVICAALAEAGLTHLHLLPAFDIATVDEDKSTWLYPGRPLAVPAPTPTEQQAAVLGHQRPGRATTGATTPTTTACPRAATRPTRTGLDAHPRVPRDGQGALRHGTPRRHGRRLQPHARERRQSDKSVLDKIVPGYYHRLNSRRAGRDQHVLPEHGDRALHDGAAHGRRPRPLGARLQGGRVPLRPDGPPHEAQHGEGARRAARAHARDATASTARPSTSTARAGTSARSRAASAA